MLRRSIAGWGKLKLFQITCAIRSQHTSSTDTSNEPESYDRFSKWVQDRLLITPRKNGQPIALFSQPEQQQQLKELLQWNLMEHSADRSRLYTKYSHIEYLGKKSSNSLVFHSFIFL
jgi:hypothetical protein